MLNKVQLIGFTGADAEIRTLQSGKRVAILRVATSRYTKKGGEKQEYTTWHQVEIWSPNTVNWLASRPLTKGSKVFVEGEIRNERYEKDGQDHYVSKVVVTGPGHELKSLDRPEANPTEEE